MKKSISLTLAMTLIIGLIGCASATPSQGTATEDAVDTAASVESTASGETAASDEAKETASSDQGAKGSADGRFHSAEYPLYAATVDLDMPIKLYFRDGAEDLPYIDTDTVMQLLNLLIATGNREFKYSSEAKGADYIITRENTMENTVDNGVYADLDFEKNIITFSDYDLFLWKPGTTTILDLINASTFNKDGEPQTLQKVDKTTLDRYGVEFVLPLRDYNIELERQDDLYLIPMQTFVDFFLSPPYNTNLFFNGQVVIAQQSIDGNELYYAAPTGERSAALAEFGYNELCMLLDYRYGLKEVHGIDKFDSLFHSANFDQLLRAPDAQNADLALAYTLYDYLDDGHTGLTAPSYLTHELPVEVDFGSSVTTHSNEGMRYLNVLETEFPDNFTEYMEVGNTAYVFLKKFSLANPNDLGIYYDVEDLDELQKLDAIGEIMYAHAQITRENSPIENVVIDLSINGGGAAESAIFTLAWLLGDASVGMENTMTGAMSSATYRADVNRDRKFDESDTVTDKNIFCLISPYSFSCGNLVPCILRESQRATLLGRTSGGGSCVVQNVSTAWGSSMQISGTHRLSFLKNGAFYDIDRGVDPDYIISSPKKMYDRKALTDYINSLY